MLPFLLDTTLSAGSEQGARDSGATDLAQTKRHRPSVDVSPRDPVDPKGLLRL